MRIRSIFVAWLCAAVFTGCSLWNLQSPAEQLGGGYIAVVALADTTTERLVAGALTADQAERISTRLKRSKAGLDVATGYLAAGDEASAKGTLAASIAILTAIEGELK